MTEEKGTVVSEDEGLFDFGDLLVTGETHRPRTTKELVKAIKSLAAKSPRREPCRPEAEVNVRLFTENGVEEMVKLEIVVDQQDQRTKLVDTFIFKAVSTMALSRALRTIHKKFITWEAALYSTEKQRLTDIDI